MKKKATLRDVAKEAGVSVATVSYVLNNVKNQTIPEETKQKVFEAAGKLQYVQNLTAKALSLGKTNLLGVLFVSSAEAAVAKTVGYGTFLDRLERRCREEGYHLLVSQVDPLRPNLGIIEERKLDGVFLIDAVEQSFHAISGHFQYGSPLVLIDSYIEDALFRKVNLNMRQLFELAHDMDAGQPAALICGQASNRLYNEKLREASGFDESHIYEASDDEAGLRAFIERHEDKRLIVINEFLALRVLKYRSPDSILAVCTSECPQFLPERMRQIRLAASKADVCFDLMSLMLKSAFSTYDDYEIGLERI